MNVHQNITPSQMKMIEAHRARQARFAAAAHKAKLAIVTKKADVEEVVIPQFLQVRKREPRTEVQQDAHVIAYLQWKVAVERFTRAIQEGQTDKTLNELLAQPPKKTVKQIISEVLEDFPGITFEDLRGSRRSRKYVRPRHLAFYEVYRQRPDLSYPAIGRLFGGFDHTSVLFAVKKIEAQKAKEMEEKS